MNKLLITLPIISLIIVGGVYFSIAPSQNDTTSVKYQDWIDCRKNYQDSDPCLKTSDFSYAQQYFFMQTTGYMDIPGTLACNRFQNHLYNIQQNNLEINYKKYYEKCFIAPIQQTDSCFYNHYFYPRYVKCAGL